jgi:hypothetical protein
VNNVIGGTQHMLGFTILRRGVWAGHLEVHAMSKEELPRGGVVKLTPITALEAPKLVVKLSADQKKELSDSRKGVRHQMQRKSLRVVQKIIKNDKIIFRTRDANNRRCSKITVN